MEGIATYGARDRRRGTQAATLAHIARETASAFEAAVKTEQPVTTKLITTCVAEHLRDEQVVAELILRSLNGENAFRTMVREVIRAEAEQIAHAAAAAAATDTEEAA